MKFVKDVDTERSVILGTGSPILKESLVRLKKQNIPNLDVQSP